MRKNENEEDQMKRYIDLTDEEQELFVSIFYECWDESFDFEKDYDSDYPWGCPWNQNGFLNDKFR